LSWDRSTGIEITESQIIDLDHFTNEDEIDPVFSSWDKSTGIEITESQITDLKDYLTEEADGDPTNELQTVVQEDYKVTLSHDGGSFITGIMSYAQAEIDAMAPYDGLTVHNSTTNCINYYYFNNWFEFCGTCTPQPTQADAGENIWIMGGVLTVTLSANIPEFGEGKWSILSGDGGSFEDDTDPHTFFTGQPYEQYTLKWTITTSCNTSYDEIWVRFRPYVCGTPFTDTRDSNDYETVIIGNQCWMAENLKYLPEVSGPEEQSYTEPYYYVNGYDGTNVNDAKASTYYNAYGVLYNWPAAVNACPLGWHLPSDAEWTQLVDYVVNQGYPNAGSNPNGAGSALKSCRQVNSPLGEDCATSEHPRWDSNNTHYGFDEFGFSALPGGSRNSNGYFYDIGFYDYWWSSNEYSSMFAWFWNMSYNYGNVSRSNSFKTHGFSVRCLRD
ncbi:MAG TPA: FISUMP domain-containing protein, partial [Bacteroidales bacterium]|nr:FISUMP domain-containing protein [Bacteroidales bacterium]